MDFLDRLRALSPEAKGRYSFLIAALCTGIAGFIWVLALPARFDESRVTQDSMSDEQESTQLTDVFDEGKKQIGSIIEGAMQAKGTTADTHDSHDPNTPETSLLGLSTTTETVTPEPATNTTPHTPITTSNEIQPATSSQPKTVSIPVSPKPKEEPAPPKPSAEPGIILIATTTTQKTE